MQVSKEEEQGLQVEEGVVVDLPEGVCLPRVELPEVEVDLHEGVYLP